MNCITPARTRKFGIGALLVLLVSASSGLAQSLGTGADLPPAEVDRIVQTFTRKESEFRQALNQYSFKRDALLQTLGMGGQVTGEYHRVSTFTFDDSGTRYEKISYFPMPSFVGSVTQEDLDDLGGISPFALDPSRIASYNIKYVGKEKIDELSLFVFDVSPKVMPDPKKIKERLFLGRIWVDDQDFQIVKTKGKGVPETKQNKFPVVETYREQIGKFWFPTYTYADEQLVFEKGDVLHVRMKVRYTDFAPARATLKITEVDGAELDKNNEAATPRAKPEGETPPAKPPAKP